AAIGEPDTLPLRLGRGRPAGGNDARDHRSALEQRAARHVGGRHAGRGFVATAHGDRNLAPTSRSSTRIFFRSTRQSLEHSSSFWTAIARVYPTALGQ